MSQNDADGNDVRTALDHYSRGIPRIGQSRTDPVVTAVTSKLIRQRGRGYAALNGNRRTLDVDHSSMFRRIADDTTNAIISARNAMQLLPDIEIAMNLLISAILSPKDMNTVEITYSQKEKVLPAATAQKMLDALKGHFETYHNLKLQLQPALHDILAETGSYPVLILAENTIDRIINSDQEITLESLSESTFDAKTSKFQSLGFLGNVPKSKTEAEASIDQFGLESLISRRVPTQSYDSKSTLIPNLHVTDNPGILRLTKIRDRLRADRTAKLMSAANIRPSFETHNQTGQLIHTSYRDPSNQAARQIAVPTTGASKRITVGHPLVMKLPSESVIPVHEPGNPTKHLGYFILLEETGNPINDAFESDYYKQMTQNYSSTVNNNFASSLLRDAKLIGLGAGATDTKMTFQQLGNLYSDLLEYELNSRLQRGVYGAGATVARPEEVYRIMLSRALANRGTQLLYVPEEMLIYMAFDYNQYGVGESLVHKSIILAGQRANLSVASVMAELKNAIARSTVDIVLDEEDDDPAGTVEHIMIEQAKLRNSAYPMAVRAPVDIVELLQNAAIDFQISGNTGYPSTKVQISDYNSNKTIPNIEFQKDLRNRHLWSFGVPPELVDATQSPEFATSIVTNNLMLAKVVMQRQDQLTPFLEKYVRTYTISDGILMEELRGLVRASKRLPASNDIETTQATAADAIGGSQGDDTDRLVLDFLAQLKISLPRPEGAKSSNIKQAYTEYKEFLELVIDSYISDAALSYELSGAIGQQGDVLKNAMMALFLRRWLRQNNAAPELEEMLDLGENDSPGLDLLTEIEAHSSPIKINLRDFIIKYLRRRASDDAVVSTAEDQTGAEAGSGSSSSTSSSSDTGGGDGGEESGGDGMSFDLGGGEEDGGEGGDDTDGDETATEETSESSSSETTTSEDGTVTKTESSSSSSSSSSG